MVSVLIPIYNAQRYLERCLESVVNQTCQDMEIILVNDGSTDNTLDICQKYAQQDQRVRIVDKPNEGVGKTRHRCIWEAKGEYFAFIDSDDYFTPDAIETMLEEMGENVDLVIGQHHRYAVDSSLSFRQVAFEIGTFELDTPQKKVEAIIRNRHGVELWNRVGRTEIAKRAWTKPSELPFGEDAIMMAQYLAYARKVVCIPQITYYYEYRQDSQARSTEKMLLLPRFVEESVDLAGQFTGDTAISGDTCMLMVHIATIALAKYKGPESRERMIAHMEQVSQIPAMHSWAQTFIKNKRYFKKQYNLSKDEYRRIMCFFNAIKQRDAWYYTRLYPSLLEGHWRAVKTVINKIIGRVRK